MSAKCVCHVCGALWEMDCDFASFPMVKVMPDGSERGFAACRSHTKEEVRAAYLKLMSPKRG